MKVKVAPLGENVVDVEIEDGATVGEILAKAGVVVNERAIRVDNVEATMDTKVTVPEGEEFVVVVLAQKMKGGRSRWWIGIR